MAVTSSTATFEGAQRDGSRWCSEVHVMSAGQPVIYRYLVPAGTTQSSVNAIATARAAQVATDMADMEAAANYARDAAPTLLHQTAAQFAARIRERFRAGTQTEACQIAWWLLRRISAGHVTDAQCQTAYGMSAAQWTTFKSGTATPRSNAWVTVLAAGSV